MTGETALITGASSGIGLELARLFAADGSKLVLVARSGEKLRELASELEAAHGVEVRVIVKDLSIPDAPTQIFDELQAAGSQVDVLVNNAGFGILGTTAELDLEEQLNMLQVNVMALTHLTRLFLPGMLERRNGAVLNLGSTAAFQAGPFMAVYYASKAFVLSFSQALAEEVGSSGVSVSCLCPGPTKTGFGGTAGTEDLLMFRMGAMDVVRVAKAGYRGLRRSKPIVVPGLMNKIGVFANRLFPRRVVCRVVKRLQRPPSR